eukprot:scaffold76502_cov19-Tisochrysis_lutea.AAC.1
MACTSVVGPPCSGGTHSRAPSPSRPLPLALPLAKLLPCKDANRTHKRDAQQAHDSSRLRGRAHACGG